MKKKIKICLGSKNQRKSKIINESKSLIVEFTGKEKRDLIAQGEDFTISYELELESGQAIDPDSGYDMDGDGEEGSRNSLYGMSSREQVDFLGYHDNLGESVEQMSAEDFFSTVYDDSTSYPVDSDHQIFNSVVTLYYTEGKINARYPTKLTDQMIETFVLAYYLEKDGVAYNTNLERFTLEDIFNAIKVSQSENFQNILNNIEELRVAEVQNAISDYTGAVDSLIGRVLGFEEDDWVIHKPFVNHSKIDYSPFKFFAELFSSEEKAASEIEETLMENYRKLVKATNYVYSAVGNSDIELGTLLNRWQSRVSEIDFNDLALGTSYLSAKASSHYDSEFESALDNFNYDDYGIDPSDYENETTNNIGSINLLALYLPNFWKKWGDEMTSVNDESLPHGHGIELKMTSHIRGLQTAMDYIELFYNDFNKQSNFSFSDDTGLHTNVSIDLSDKKFNLMKGLLFLSEETTKGASSVAYRGIESRFSAGWSSGIKKEMFRTLKSEIDKNDDKKTYLKMLYKTNNFDKITDYLNEAINDQKHRFGVKSYGFNMHYTNSRGYIEFRYPGGEVNEKDLKELTLYYSFIVKNCLDSEYKKEDYKIKLIKFLNEVLFVEDTQLNAAGKLKYLKKQFDEHTSMNLNLKIDSLGSPTIVMYNPEKVKVESVKTADGNIIKIDLSNVPGYMQNPYNSGYSYSLQSTDNAPEPYKNCIFINYGYVRDSIDAPQGINGGVSIYKIFPRTQSVLRDRNALIPDSPEKTLLENDLKQFFSKYKMPAKYILGKSIEDLNMLEYINVYSFFLSLKRARYTRPLFSIPSDIGGKDLLNYLILKLIADKYWPIYEDKIRQFKEEPSNEAEITEAKTSKSDRRIKHYKELKDVLGKLLIQL